MSRKILSATDINKILSAAKGFDRVLNKIKVLSAENGKLTATMKIEEDHSNIMGGLHGGLSTTIVDSISSYALMSHPNGATLSVSVNINMEFIKGAKVGEEVEIVSDTIKIGKTLAFLELHIKDKKTGSLLVKGTHTKYFLPQNKTSEN